MPEENDKNIRIPVKGEEGKHTGHKIRTIVVSASQGIKALYCVDDKKIITYIFAKNKGWTLKKAQAWVTEHTKVEKKLDEVWSGGDEFDKIIAVNLKDLSQVDYLPNSDSFILEKEIEEFTTGIANSIPDESAESNSEESIDICKVDKQKQIVYGVFLVPEKADHDGDVISAEDIEKVAHGFLVEYRDVDEMHSKTTMAADVVESGIAWKDMDFYGKKITKGTWFGGIKIHDREVWEKVLTGEYKAFSVRIAGIREPIEEEGK